MRVKNALKKNNLFCLKLFTPTIRLYSYDGKELLMIFGKLSQRSKIKSFERQLEDLYATDYKKMYRIALSYTHSEQAAYDLISECFQKALAAFPKTKEIDNFSAWFYRILVRAGIDAWRKSKRTPEEIDIDKMQQAFSTSDFTLVDQLELQEVLDHLESPGREIILLKFFEGFTFKEIAGILDINENTVKTTMYRTLNTLKDILSD